MTSLQLILTIAVGVISIASIVFMVMFIVEMRAEDEAIQPEVKSIFSSENYAEKNSAEVNNMLANLDREAEEVVEEQKEEVVVEETAQTAPQQINQVINIVVGDVSNKKEEEQPQEIVIEPAEEVIEEQKEEVISEEPAEVQNEISEEIPETISAENLLDYKARLDKIVQNRDKIEKDLVKLQKSILNYERTKRRKARNQKMLDRRASELTNLNLIMYSVTDIKNVDEDKKIKQEELTSHIAELKASIQDADEFLDSNKEKNDHNIKMAKFLMQEKSRYSEEIAELEKLIAKTENNAA